MNKKINLHVLVLLGLTSWWSVHGVILVVHGTFAAEESWYREGGDFHSALLQTAQQHNEQLVSFTWSGKLDARARIRAATALAITIAHHHLANNHVCAVGHSHGSNIIILASQLLNAILPECVMPYEETLPRRLLELVDEDLPDAQWTTMVQEAHIQVQSAIAQLQTTPFRHQKPFYIEKAYLLATPVDIKRYLPAMNIIGNAYHFYSLGDLVQPVLWQYGRIFPPLERCWNIEVTLETKDGSTYCPGHSTMRDPQIAQFLLDLPTQLESLTQAQAIDPNLRLHINRHQQPLLHVTQKET